MYFINSEKIIENGKTSELKKIRKDILEILSAATDSVDPYNSVKEKLVDLDFKKFESIYLVAFGKASIGMSRAICDSVEIKKGFIITNNPDEKLDNARIKVFVGGHPIPNKNGIMGAEESLKLVDSCKEKDLLIVLISGGGSALLAKPKISLEDLQKTTDLLLNSGANINEINTIRKHLSLVKGGQLIKNVKCKVLSLVISDIINDPLEFIASGPTYPDSTTYKDAEKIFEKYNLYSKIPKSVKTVIEDGISGEISETLKKENPIFNNVEHHIVANNDIACDAAAKKSKELGYRPLILTTTLDGEAREVGKYLSEKAINHIINNEKVAFISGGETTVTIKGDGKGGRNQEMVLGAIESLKGKNVVFSSYGTDGIDGKSDAAGAIADSYSYQKAREKNLDFNKFLKNNDSNTFFNQTGDLLITGPTGTNVMDIQILIKY